MRKKTPFRSDRHDSEFALWDGKYIKAFYLVRLPGGDLPCWPNAGLMMAVDGSGRSWSPKAGIKVCRITTEEAIGVQP